MIVGVTGHRKLDHKDEMVAQRFIHVLNELSIVEPITEVITGMAIGFDQLIAQCCVQLDIPFIAAVPFVGQDAVWPQRCKDEYHELLLKAKRVEILSEGGFANWKFIQRNNWIVDNSNVLVGYLPHDKDSGTKHCMDYGFKTGLRTVNIGTVLPQDSAGVIKSWFSAQSS